MFSIHLILWYNHLTRQGVVGIWYRVVHYTYCSYNLKGMGTGVKDSTVKLLKFQTSRNFAIITLKFEHGGFTIE